MAQAYLAWAGQLAGKKDYQTAIDKLTVILNDYSDTTVAGQAMENSSVYMVAWAQEMESNQEYDAAEIMTPILASYQDTPAVKQAREAVAQVYLSWAKQLSGQQKCASAVTELNIFMENYTDTAALSDAREIMAQALLCWANQNIEELSVKFPVFSRSEAATNQPALSEEALHLICTPPTEHATPMWVNLAAPASTKLSTIVEDYSDTAVVPEARETYAWYLLNWGKILKGGKCYGDAVMQLQAVTHSYSDTPYATEAAVLLKQISWVWP